MRSLPLVLLLLLATTGEFACAAAGSAPASAATLTPLPPMGPGQGDGAQGRRSQKVELIRLEDSANVIDEVRYGGQTQSITVQPKNRMPEYEVQPTDLSRTRPLDHRDGANGIPGRSLWNVRKF